jgi:hypothetical protein
MNKSTLACMIFALGAMSGSAVAAQPAAGETYVYRVVNGYNNVALGKIEYRVARVDADRVALSVTTDVPALGMARTEIYDRDGNWLRHALTNQDHPVEYEFAQPYAAYALPLDTGKSWSVRVNATNPATGRRNSVRIDGEVLGAERITVPAGAFDTIKIKRRVYAGDWGAFTFETNIYETEWYAPALGRAVRSETSSEYLDTSRGIGGGSFSGPIQKGDWNVFELVSSSK